MTYMYEIFLESSNSTKSEWAHLLSSMNSLMKNLEKWHLMVYRIHETIHYYVESYRPLPASPGISHFLLKRIEEKPIVLPKLKTRPYLNKWEDSFLSISQKLSTAGENLYAADISIVGFGQTVKYSTISIYSEATRKFYKRKLLLADPSSFLSADFLAYPSFNYKKFPKYFKIDKIAGSLIDTTSDAMFEVDTFPYFCDQKKLCHNAFDFTKHSLVLGGSGTGKSRFLASFIDQIYRTHPEDMKIVVIDPHDAIYKDCGSVKSQKVINFCDQESSIDLFSYTDEANIISNVEITLSLFRNMIGKNYNGRLERVLRYSIHLLVTAGTFCFMTLQKLFNDTDYRNQLIANNRNNLPSSISRFFLTDFNELKTQHYNDTFAPILALIDEMLIVPTFNSAMGDIGLNQTLEENFLTIFSLSQLKLGEKVVQTIAGLLMQQLFILAEGDLKQQLIIIIDEVAIIEQPILARFLSELRKYKVTVILASQYFGQISEGLRMSIFANATNYYIFRTSQDDASTLTSHLKIQPANCSNTGEAEKIITKLKNRECLLRVMNWQGEIIPAFKAHVADFDPPPFKKIQVPRTKQNNISEVVATLDFCFNTDGCNIAIISKKYSTGRKKVKKS